jgi:hypothetical protein
MTPSAPPSPQTAHLKPNDLLRECPPWPTMQWLPRKPVQELDGCRRTLEQEGFTTSRVELVCALILACDPGDPSLLADLRSYKAGHRGSRLPRTRARGVPLMLRMVSPITLRLDILVRSLSESDQRIYRHELVGTLITRAAADPAGAEEACRVFRQAKAHAAAVKGHPRRLVLTQERPRQGARSF